MRLIANGAGGEHAVHHDADAVEPESAARTRECALFRPRGGVAPAGQIPVSLQLRRGVQARAPAGAGAAARRRRARRGGGYADVEPLGPPRSVLRHSGRRGGAAHPQPAPFGRGSGLYHRRRGRPADPDRRCAAADLGQGQAAAGQGSARRRVRIQRRAIARRLRELRGFHRSGCERLPLSGAGRERGHGHVLYLGHHRPAQGRGVFAPLDGAAFDRERDAGCARLVLARQRARHHADVSCQRLGNAVHCRDARARNRCSRVRTWRAKICST